MISARLIKDLVIKDYGEITLDRPWFTHGALLKFDVMGGVAKIMILNALSISDNNTTYNYKLIFPVSASRIVGLVPHALAGQEVKHIN